MSAGCPHQGSQARCRRAARAPQACCSHAFSPVPGTISQRQAARRPRDRVGADRRDPCSQHAAGPVRSDRDLARPAAPPLSTGRSSAPAPPRRPAGHDRAVACRSPSPSSYAISSAQGDCVLSFSGIVPRGTLALRRVYTLFMRSRSQKTLAQVFVEVSLVGARSSGVAFGARSRSVKELKSGPVHSGQFMRWM